MAKDNPSWGYLRITGALKNLGHEISKSTVSNILKNNGINPSGARKHGGMSWNDFIRLHKDVIWASDFFTTEVWTTFGLITYYVLFFIHLSSRRIVIGGITANPDGPWMAQIARNLTGCDCELSGAKHLIHDGDKKYTEQFDSIFKSAGIKPIRLPPFSPNLNCYAENFVGKIKSESLNHIIFVGEKSLRKAVTSYVEFYLHERNHQGLENIIPFPDTSLGASEGEIACKERLGGLLKYYYRKAA
jgi:transposase InsO family protein